MYKCNSCGKEFFFEGQLKRHTLFNHPQAEQPSSLFTEIERQVRGNVTAARPTFHAYSALESIREEDLSVEWCGSSLRQPPTTVNNATQYVISSTPVQITPPTWVANPVSW